MSAQASQPDCADHDHSPRTMENPLPRYRITRMLNERSATKYDFEAADDEEALRLLHDETRLDAALESSGDADVVDPDALDETRGLDRFEDGAWLMLVDELSLKSHMPYSTPSREFAARVAGLGGEAPMTTRPRRSTR